MDNQTSYRYKKPTFQDHCWSAVMWGLFMVPVVSFVGEL